MQKKKVGQKNIMYNNPLYMEIPFLPNNNQHDPVSFLKEGGKYDGIKNKLCEKRNSLEKLLTTCTEIERDEPALELMRLKESMRTFGVTEIDYQIYLETIKNTEGKVH